MCQHSTTPAPRRPINIQALRLLLQLERQRRESQVHRAVCHGRVRALQSEVRALRGVIADEWLGGPE